MPDALFVVVLYGFTGSAAGKTCDSRFNIMRNAGQSAAETEILTAFNAFHAYVFYNVQQLLTSSKNRVQ